MSLTKLEIIELQNKFLDLVNNESDDPDEPINPLTYKSAFDDNCLHIAALRADLDSIKLLIKGGLNINKQGDMGNTALHYAQMSKDSEIFDFLLSCGAELEIENDFGKKPLRPESNK